MSREIPVVVNGTRPEIDGEQLEASGRAVVLVVTLFGHTFTSVCSIDELDGEPARDGDIDRLAKEMALDWIANDMSAYFDLRDKLEVDL